MLKFALLAGSILIASPAFAQDKPGTPQSAPATQTAPTTPDQAVPATPQDVAPAQTATPRSVTPAPAAPTQDATVAAVPAAAQPAAATQIASVVDTEFASYDKDKNGTLSAKEFDAWMLALKTKSDPATKPASKETKAWLGQAFAQADTDKSKSVSKTELTGFLSLGQS